MKSDGYSAKLFLVAFLILSVGPSLLGATITLVSTGSVWRYLDDGSDQGTAWRSLTFNDTDWKFGRAQLGYGEGDEATVVGYGPEINNKYITTWFRSTFVATNNTMFTNLLFRILRDDGAAVYLNGTRVLVSN